MPNWKKNIFKRAIKARMIAEDLTREEVLLTYPKLTEEEKTILRQEIPQTPAEI